MRQNSKNALPMKYPSASQNIWRSTKNKGTARYHLKYPGRVTKYLYNIEVTHINNIKIDTGLIDS